ncbi:MAG: efflux RND transporter periplasmic adaptor subunit [candidate division Zixibacteria bacterium]|nr:efflux RND transporter periplasmic adaptor subunit [candidate division Zixibacteria bacterium]
MKTKTKIFIGAGAGLVVLALVLVNLKRSSSSEVKVEAEKLKRSDIVSIVTANGKVKPKTDVKISANISAQIIELPVEEGDRIKRGQLLVGLDPGRYQAALDQAKAQLKLEKANLEQAEQNFNRIKPLFEKNLASQEQYDLVQTQLAVVRARHEAAQHNIEQAQDDLAKTRIASPIDGIVSELRAEKGETVIPGTMNNPGTVIMTVSDLSSIEVEVDVDETDIALVKTEQTAEISVDAFRDTTFKGRVVEVGSSALAPGSGLGQEQVTNFRVKILLLDKVAGIKPGMTATADITTAERKNVLAVPIQAVVLRDSSALVKAKEKDKKDSGAFASTPSSNPSGNSNPRKKKELEGVFVIRDGKAVFVPVSVGIADQTNIEVLSGLQEGDMVITGSYKTLRTLENEAKVKTDEKGKKAS